MPVGEAIETFLRELHSNTLVREIPRSAMKSIKARGYKWSFEKLTAPALKPNLKPKQRC